MPWSRVGLAACLVVVLMELVRRWPWSMWPLEGTAVGVLAGATAWCFDEPAAAVVDGAPRGLAWRTLVRAVAPALLLAVWLCSVYFARASLFDHPWHVALQGVSAAVTAAAVTTWQRSRGRATPGLGFAAAVIPLASAWAIVRPFSGTFPVFPYADGRGEFGSWDSSSVIWSLLLVSALVLVAAALTEARWRLAGRRGRDALDTTDRHTARQTEDGRPAGSWS